MLLGSDRAAWEAAHRRDMFLHYMKETGKLPFLEGGSEFKNWKFASAFEKPLGWSCLPWQIVRQRKGTVDDRSRIWFRF